jgi:uncharacterized protein
MINVTYFLFPIYGSHYDPRIAGLIITFVAVIVVVVWRPRTLARYENACLGQPRRIIFH